MATITTQTIKVDLTPGRVYPVLHVSQGDVGLEALEFHIYQNGQPFTIPSEITAINIDGMTPVGVFSYPCTWSGNVVTAGLTATMTAERGIDICELAFYDATNNKIGTCNFVIAVEESPFTNAHVSTSDMATIMAAASSAQQYELLSKSWAVGDTGIRTGEDTNNSEYWSKISESWAVGGTGKRTGENTNNSEYWSTVSHQYANTISFKTYDTVAQMTADSGLLDGGVCRTLGYYAANDGGGAFYKIKASAPTSYYETLGNGLFAELIMSEFVTPEMFGAAGDGTTDDTTAWQNAVDSGKDVVAANNNYKCGKITVSKNIDIDCSGANFLCTSDILFELAGEVVTTLTSQNDYAANNCAYKITGANYSDYTGFAFIKGTNNFAPSRDYYKGGIACEFIDGQIGTPSPVAITSVSIDIINPITCKLHNVGSITHTVGTTTFSIHVVYGVNCCIENVNGNYSSYACIDIEKSLRCFCRNIHITNDYNGQSYIVVIADSSFCGISNSNLHNNNWHAVSTGGEYICLNNSIDCCTLESDVQYAFLDHANSFGTQITSSTISSLYVNGLCYLDGITVTPVSSNKIANVIVYASDVESCAIYNINNIKVCVDNSVADSAENGLKIVSPTGQTTGITRYVKRLNINNFKSANSGKITASISVEATETLVLEEININEFNGRCYLGKYNNAVTITNYVLNIDHMNNFTDGGIFGASNDMEFNIVKIENSKIYQIRGKFNELIFNNLEVYLQINSITVANKLIGGLLIGFIPNAQLLIPTRLSIAMISVNDNYTYYNYANDRTVGRYYTKYNNGALSVVQIT